LNYARFMLNYLATVSKEPFEERVPSLLYVIAVSSLVSINTINQGHFRDAGTSLDTLVNRDILGDEQLTERLLAVCLALVKSKNGKSLCLLLALRTLGSVMKPGRTEAIMEAGAVQDFDATILAVCCAALRLQDVERVYKGFNEYPASRDDWICRFEMACTWKDSAGVLQLLDQFSQKGQISFQNELFK
uniref:WAPL domain-containing protein n=1 Tax=Gongylonema pulchrum TaxID=637853 RepID=A0A183D9J1_9BILA